MQKIQNAKHENYFVIFQEQYNENDSDINIGISNKEAAQQVINMGVEQGMNQTLDQLDALLK